jgi:hypothetical protein
MTVLLDKQPSSYLADRRVVIETDLTDEERAIIADGDRRFKEHPEDFVTLESIRRDRVAQ